MIGSVNSAFALILSRRRLLYRTTVGEIRRRFAAAAVNQEAHDQGVLARGAVRRSRQRYFRLIDRSTDMVGVVERRDKMGFPVPLIEWFGGPLNGFVSEIFDQQRSRRRDYFNTDVVLANFQAAPQFSRKTWGLSQPGTVGSTLP
jgi:hypothetical protein